VKPHNFIGGKTYLVQSIYQRHIVCEITGI